jgi:hypothetical protein
LFIALTIGASRVAGPARLGREHDQRFSFCCAVDGCRSRATPPSLRFLGPKVYIAAIVVPAEHRFRFHIRHTEHLSEASEPI